MGGSNYVGGRAPVYLSTFRLQNVFFADRNPPITPAISQTPTPPFKLNEDFHEDMKIQIILNLDFKADKVLGSCIVGEWLNQRI